MYCTSSLYLHLYSLYMHYMFNRNNVFVFGYMANSERWGCHLTTLPCK